MSRWIRLFGSPTDAAYTIIDRGLLYDLLIQCDECPKASPECYDPKGKCQMENVDAVLEWLMQEVDE